MEDSLCNAIKKNVCRREFWLESGWKNDICTILKSELRLHQSENYRNFL